MSRLALFACLIGSALVPAGCQPNGKLGQQPEKPEILVSKPAERDVTDYVDYTGQTNAKESVVIQPRVTGYLVKMPFEEGKDVKKDDILFEVDPRPYKAQFEAAEASAAQNKAGLLYAQLTNEQFTATAKKSPDAVTKRELNQYQALEDQALASLNYAKANLVSAKLNLEWTSVKSPIDGRISRYYLTKGNLVNQDVTNLTTVVSMDPMYVSFYLDEPTLLRIKRAINEGRINPPRINHAFAASTIGLLGTPLAYGDLLASSSALAGSDAPVLMGLQGEEGFPHQGSINFIDNQVNPGTGSILLRGVFANPLPPNGTYLLTPGMFVRVRLPIGQPQKQLLVIDRAIISEQGAKKIYIVDKDNKVQERVVTLGALQEDGLRVVSGDKLTKDDWVVVGSLQRVRPRMEVRREELPKMPDATSPIDLSKGR